MAALCKRFLESVPAVEEANAPSLCTMLQRATETVTNVAQKLLSKRFGQSLSEVNASALLICPVCNDDILSGILMSLLLYLSCFL